jgi:polysaccharide biosynthesis transport protein
MIKHSETSKTLLDGASPLTLRDALTPLFRHKRMVILTFCSVFLASTLFAWLWAAHYYVAKMQVVVEQDRSDPAITTAQSAAVTSNRALTVDQISSEVALLQGQDMMRTVAATCGLANGWSFADFMLPSDPSQRRAAKLEGAALGLEKHVNVEAEKNSDVIDVKYGRKGDPGTPACVLQTLSKLYLEKHLQLRRPAGSTAFFSQQTDKYQQALADAELRLTDFSRESGVADPDELRTDMAQQVSNTEAALYQAKQAVVADEQRILNVQRQLETTPSRSPTQRVSNSANILLEQLGTNLVTAQNKRNELAMKFATDYPLVREADKEIAEIQAAITQAEQTKYVNEATDRDPTYELLREDLAKTQADLSSQKAEAAALADSIQSMNHQMVDLDAKAVKQGALVREAKADEANYLLYLNKREQERASDALDAKSIADVAIAVPAVVPALPAHSPLLITVAGFVFAIFAAISVAFVAEYIDGSFRTPEEVSETLGIPVLATVPRQAA